MNRYFKANIGGSVGKKLLKTGQTTSYRTGDDGDLEDGRDVDFLTLPANNPFGNTNRFTDTLGSAIYANDWVIDWSTYDNSVVLGYYRIPQGNPINWSNSIDGALAGTFGTFSGCKLPNSNELLNIRNMQTTIRFNYSPFNISSPGWLWSATASGSGVAYASAITSTNALIIRAASDFLTYAYIPVRIFTVTGTTLS